MFEVSKEAHRRRQEGGDGVSDDRIVRCRGGVDIRWADFSLQRSRRCENLTSKHSRVEDELEFAWFSLNACSPNAAGTTAARTGSGACSPLTLVDILGAL